MAHEVDGVATKGGEVAASFDGPRDAAALLVLAHGAGGDMDSEFMTTTAHHLAAAGLRVCRFNFPYSQRGRRGPDPQPVLGDAYRAVVARAAREEPPFLVLGGKSLGGRIASHVVAAGVHADALVFLGYPLHPPGKPERLRDAHLRAIKTPMLFVEGTRDPFCPLPTLETVRERLSAPTTVAVIDGGDHSLKVPRSSGRSTQDAWAEAAAATAEWVTQLAARRQLH